MGHLVGAGQGYQNRLEVVFLSNQGGATPGFLPYRLEQDVSGAWSYCGILPHDSHNTGYDDMAVTTSNLGLQVILVGQRDGKLYFTQQDPNTGNWSACSALPNPFGSQFQWGAIAAGTDSSGLAQVICSANGDLHLFRQDPSGSNYNYIGKLPNYSGADYIHLEFGNAGTPVLALLDQRGQPYLTSQGPGGWSSPVKMDNPQKLTYVSLATGISNQNTLNVILISEAGQPYVVEYDANLVGKNQGVIPPNMVLPAFASVTTRMGNGGTPQVICLGRDGQPYLLYQSHDTGEWYSYWVEVNGALPTNPQRPAFSAVAAASGNSNNLQVICLDPSGQPSLIWQDYQNGSWHYYGPLPYVTQVRFVRTVIGVGNGGNFQVVCLGEDGQLYLSWQDSSSWAWNKFDLLPVCGVTIPRCSTQTYPGNALDGPLAMGVGYAGNLQLIFLGADDGRPYVVSQYSDGSWHLGPQPIDTAAYCGVTTGTGAAGELQVILRDGMGELHRVSQSSTDGSWTHQMSPSSDMFSSVATAIGSDGNLQVVGLTGNVSMGVASQDAYDPNSWTGGELPSDPNNPLWYSTFAVCMGADGRLQVIVLRQGVELDCIYEADGNWWWGGKLNAWPGTQSTVLAMCLSWRGLFLFIVGEDGNLYWMDQNGWTYNGQYAFGNGAYSVPTSNAVTCGNFGDGGSMVIALGNDGRTYFEECHPQAPNGGAGPWYNYGLLQ